MCLEVRYVPYYDKTTKKQVVRPVIPVTMEHLSNSVSTIGLIDSGSEFTLFSAEWGIGIGIPVDRGEVRNIDGIGGSIPCTEHEAVLKFLNGEHAKEIKTKIMFSRKFKGPFVLLGRDAIFKLYDITFKDKEEKFIFKKI